MLETLGASTKALIGAAIKSIPFATYGVTPYASGTASGYRDGNFWTAGYSGNHQPGAQYDYNADAGELLDNPIIAAGSDLLGQALPAAPPILQEKRGSDWKDVPDSDEVGLLMTPMQPDASGHTNGYGGFHLWRWVVGFEMTRGEAFWLVDSGKNGLPAQLRVERPEDFRVLPSRDKWVSGYEILIDGKAYPLKDKEVVHFRHALDHTNPRRGWSPALSAKRHVAGDNRAATYQAALMRNVAAIGLLIGIKDGEAAARMTPDQVEDFVRTVKSINGENAGMSKGLNLPLDVHKLGLTPDEMALEKLVAYYETRICAAIGIDPMLLSLGGSENRTYSNYAEAEEALWRRCIQPRRTRHSSELGAQYLPLWGRDPSKYRIWWDYSDVAALQEDKDNLHMRVREDYKAGGIDRYMFLMETNRAATEADKGVYATGASATQGDEEQAPVASGDEANTATQGDETKSVWVESEHPRDSDGKFEHGGGRYTPAMPSNMREHLTKLADDSGVRYTSLKFGVTKGRDWHGNTLSNGRVQLSALIENPESLKAAMDKDQSEWEKRRAPNAPVNYFADPSPEGVLFHELGHVVGFPQSFIDNPEIMASLASISGYAWENRNDWAEPAAEAFTAWKAGKTVHPTVAEWFAERTGGRASGKSIDSDYTPTMTNETKTAPDDINADSFMAAFNAAKANVTGGEILESPAPLPDPFGIGFTDAELEALTDTNSEEAVKLAFGKSTEAKRALLGARVLEQEGATKAWDESKHPRADDGRFGRGGDIYYHGTNKLEGIRKNGFSLSGEVSEGSSFMGDNIFHGIYISENADAYGEGGQLEDVQHVVKVKVAAKNILKTDFQGILDLHKKAGISQFDEDAPQRLTAYLQSKGYDGVSYDNETVIFNPKHVTLHESV